MPDDQQFPPYQGTFAQRRALRETAVRQIMAAPLRQRPALWKRLMVEWGVGRNSLCRWRRELGIYIERGPDSEAARQAVEAVRGGMHRYRAARIYGIGQPSLKIACERAGLVGPRGVKPELRQKAVELVREHKALPADIAGHLNVSPATVRQWVKQARQQNAG
jgi:transposase-like protein